MTKQTAIKEMAALDISMNLLRHNLSVCAPQDREGYLRLVNMVLDQRLVFAAGCDKKVSTAKEEKLDLK